MVYTLVWFGGARGYHSWRTNRFKSIEAMDKRISFLEANKLKWHYCMLSLKSKD